MPRFVVCRSFVVRTRWLIEATDEKDALAALDDTDRTPLYSGDEENEGKYSSIAPETAEDAVIEL